MFSNPTPITQSCINPQQNKNQPPQLNHLQTLHTHTPSYATLIAVGLRGSSQTPGVAEGNMDSSSFPSSFYLIKTRKREKKTLDSPSVLISFSYTSNKKQNSTPSQIKQTCVTNSQAVTHKICMAIHLHGDSPTFTSLQQRQRQSISLASFLQCPHLHQSGFPTPRCNKSSAKE